MKKVNRCDKQRKSQRVWKGHLGRHKDVMIRVKIWDIKCSHFEVTLL